ncbi:unnamed protein product [Ectocarpus sp. 8 AP-2014]
MFLGVTADVSSWNGDGTAFSLLLYDNPLIGEIRGTPSSVQRAPLLQPTLRGNSRCPRDGADEGFLPMRARRAQRGRRQRDQGGAEGDDGRRHG